MIKIIDLNYHANNEFSSPKLILQMHESSLRYTRYIKRYANIEVIKHIDFAGTILEDGIKCSFFKRSQNFFQIPFRTHSYIKRENPDFVIIQGLIFPLQVIFLRMVLGKSCKLLIQHHGEQPWKGIPGFIQKMGAERADAFLFTSLGNADEWIQKKIIRKEKKCFEVLEASTSIKKRSREESIYKTGFIGDWNFLWVGRLNTNKDPLTVLEAFEKYIQFKQKAKLFLIYQEAELLDRIENILSKKSGLEKNIILLGKIAHEEMSYYYSAANFYISGSHKEGSGYALIEAMACGCIPIVTAIPSFQKITDNGKFGFLYESGNPISLLETLKKLDHIERSKYSERVIQYFNNKLSFKAIALNLFDSCISLINKKEQHFTGSVAH